MTKKYWLGLSLIPGVGPIRVKRLIERFGSPERVWTLSAEELRSLPGFGDKLVRDFIQTRNEFDLERFLQQCTEAEIHVLCPEDSEFPHNLLNIYDPPPVIYYRGSLKSEDLHSIAIVGSRKMTAYGERVTRTLSTDLARKGYTIVSGMALGIDGIAHQAALDAGGRTLAVLGCGVDIVYPREHRHLYEAIQRSGAVISTFPPGTAPEKGNFPARNRIISGLSYGTIVVEAGERSGALITADQALEQNREVFAVPGSIFSPMSGGTNALIQKGAKLVTSAEDILAELAPLQFVETAKVAVQPEKTALSDAEQQIVTLLASGELGLDELVHQLGINIAELNTLLFDLELKGVIRQYPGLKFALI